ncbi:hypothetical protein C0585_02465 [Candidatus Woesearchaeota archaeon]|nr:MAG: hypothetical protein C0585_02465 [Candidatus Woesearchaeota archaeon]
MSLDEKVIWKISMTLQKKEVEEHKYFLSESANRGIDFRGAFYDFIDQDHAKMFRISFEENKEEIFFLCKNYCGEQYDCKGFEKCPMPNDEMHRALKDGIYKKDDS